MSQQLLNSFHLLIVKALNDMENRMENKLSQLRNVVNDKMSLLDRKTKSQLSQFQNCLNAKIDTLHTKIENRLAQNFKNLHNKIDALENRMEDRLSTCDTCQEKADVKLQTLQSNVDARIGTLENSINDKLDAVGGRLEDKIDDNSLQLNDKLSQKLANYSTGSKTDIINILKSLMQKSQEEQKTSLGNFSEDVDNNLNKTLARIETNFEARKKTGEIFDYKNQTRKVLDVLTSINSTQSQHFQAPSFKKCYRGMAKDAPKRNQRLVLIRDNTLDRDILCDTRTDGGGWIVIQRRTKGDVDFYRNWAAYKNGFGTPPGDFWLGNEAIYELTNMNAYELRVDLDPEYDTRIDDLFDVYSSFRLESEVDNYRLRLGSHSGTLGVGESSSRDGLSYHNGMQFSTYDRDNDRNTYWNCAETHHGAWWYNSCLTSNLNGVWREPTGSGLMWTVGSVAYFASSTEMKIRRVIQATFVNSLKP